MMQRTLIALLAFAAALSAQGQRRDVAASYTAALIPSVNLSPINTNPYIRALGVNTSSEAVVLDCRGLFDGAGCGIYFWSPKTGTRFTTVGYTLGSCYSHISLVPVLINQRGEIGGNLCGFVFLWSLKSGVTQLATLQPFSIYNQAVALTDQGEIAGTTFVAPYYVPYFASARAGAVTLPFTNTSNAIDMNDRGEMIGYSGGPFYWSLSSGVIAIKTPGAATVRSIARDGTVLGTSQSSTGAYSLFLWDRHHGVLATAGLADGCSPFRHTSSGLVVGACAAANNTMRMWTWTARNGFRYYAPVPAFTLNAMNEDGEVVGTYNQSYPLTHAYFWSADTGLIDLDRGYNDRSSTALAIAEDGTIGGSIGPNGAVWTQGRH